MASGTCDISWDILRGVCWLVLRAPTVEDTATIRSLKKLAKNRRAVGADARGPRARPRYVQHDICNVLLEDAEGKGAASPLEQCAERMVSGLQVLTEGAEPRAHFAATGSGCITTARHVPCDETGSCRSAVSPNLDSSRRLMTRKRNCRSRRASFQPQGRARRSPPPASSDAAPGSAVRRQRSRHSVATAPARRGNVAALPYIMHIYLPGHTRLVIAH